MLNTTRPPSSAPQPPPSSQSIRVPKPWAPIPTTTTTSKSASPWITPRVTPKPSTAVTLTARLPTKTTPSPSLSSSSEESPHAMAIYAASDHSAQQTKDKGGVQLTLLSRHNLEPHKTLWLPASAINDRTYILGRSADATLDDNGNFVEPVGLQGRVVSRKHLYIKVAKSGTSVMIKDLKSSHGTTVETPPILAGSRWGTRQIFDKSWWPLKTDDRLFLGKGVTRSGRDYRPLQYEVKIISKPTPASVPAQVATPVPARYSTSLATARQPFRTSLERTAAFGREMDALREELAKCPPTKSSHRTIGVRYNPEDDDLDSSVIPWAMPMVAHPDTWSDDYEASKPHDSERSSTKPAIESANAARDAEKDVTMNSAGAKDVAASVLPTATQAAAGEEQNEPEDSEADSNSDDEEGEDYSDEEVDAASVDSLHCYDPLTIEALGTVKDRAWSPREAHNDSDADSELEGGAPSLHESELLDMCFDTERDEREHYLARIGRMSSEHAALKSDSQLAERWLFFGEMKKIANISDTGSAKKAAQPDDLEAVQAPNAADDCHHPEEESRCQEKTDNNNEQEEDDGEDDGDDLVNWSLFRKATLRQPSLDPPPLESIREESLAKKGTDSPSGSKVTVACPESSKSKEPNESEASAPAEEWKNDTEATGDEQVPSTDSAENVHGDDTVEDEGSAGAEDSNNDAEQAGDADESESEEDLEDSADDDDSFDSEESINGDASDDEEESVEDEDAEEQSPQGVELYDNDIQAAEDGSSTHAEGGHQEGMALDTVSFNVEPSPVRTFDNGTEQDDGCDRPAPVCAGLKRSIDEVEPEEIPQSTNEEFIDSAESCTSEQPAEVVIASTCTTTSNEETTPATSASLSSSSSAFVTRARASLDRLRTVKRPRLSIEIDTARVRDVACGVALGAVGTFFGLAAVGAAVDGA